MTSRWPCDRRCGRRWPGSLVGWWGLVVGRLSVAHGGAVGVGGSPRGRLLLRTAEPRTSISWSPVEWRQTVAGQRAPGRAPPLPAACLAAAVPRAFLAGAASPAANARLARFSPPAQDSSATRASAAGGIVRGMRAKRWSLSVPLDGFTLAEHGRSRARRKQLGYTDAWSFEVDGIGLLHAARRRRGARPRRAWERPSPTCTRAGPRRSRAERGGPGGAGARTLPASASARAPSPSWRRGTAARRAPRHAGPGDDPDPPPGARRRARRFRGETLAVDGFRLTLPLGRARAHPHRRRSRPGMSRRAGEVGDGAIITGCPPETCAPRSQVVREAAEKAGRDPTGVEITARLLINVDPPSPASDQLAVRRQSTAIPMSPSTAPSTSGWAAPKRSERCGMPGRRRSQGGGRRRSRRSGGRPDHPRLDAGDPGARAALSGGRRGNGLPLRLHARDRSRAEAAVLADAARALAPSA